MAITKKHLMEELGNIVKNAPVFPGDTISHQTANALGSSGFAQRNSEQDWVPTEDGQKFWELWLRLPE